MFFLQQPNGLCGNTHQSAAPAGMNRGDDAALMIGDPALRVDRERYRMINARTMWWEATITDPKVFTRPWTMRFPAPHVKLGDAPEDVDFDFEDYLKNRRRYEDETGYAKTIHIVDAPGDWFGTVRLDALEYENVDLEEFYPFGNPEYEPE